MHNDTTDFQYASLPAELRALRQWTGSRDKRPINPHTGYPASVTDPQSWGSLLEARAGQRRHGYNALSFMFTAHDPFIGIDFDHCVDRDRGINDRVSRWLCRLDSYSEISGSGTGIHTIARGVLDAACKTNWCEMYDRGRCFVMTGSALPGLPRTIERRQGVVNSLLREARPGSTARPALDVWGPDSPVAAPSDLRGRAATGRIRTTTLMLLDSTGSAGYGSASEADSALACGLVGAGLMAHEVIELIVSSARGEDACRRKGERHAAAYWKRTTEHAARFVGPTYLRGETRVRRLPLPRRSRP